MEVFQDSLEVVESNNGQQKDTGYEQEINTLRYLQKKKSSKSFFGNQMPLVIEQPNLSNKIQKSRNIMPVVDKTKKVGQKSLIQQYSSESLANLNAQGNITFQNQNDPTPPLRKRFQLESVNEFSVKSWALNETTQNAIIDQHHSSKLKHN